MKPESFGVMLQTIGCNILEGLYSGIPLCCIWSYSVKGRHLYVAAAEWGMHPEDYLQVFPAGYVQCRKCECSGHMVQIRQNGRLFK